MSAWAYRFTTKKKSQQDTERLLRAFHFVARSAYKRMASGAAGGAISNVARVVPEDTLHLYYIEKKGPRPMGTFRILDPGSRGAGFLPVWPTKEAALAKVLPDVTSNRGLLDLLEQEPTSGEGYLPDPKLGVFTGWLVEPVPGRTQPRYEDIQFPPRNTLVRVDGGALVPEKIDDELLSRIVHDTEVMGGKPCIRGTRVTVGTLLGLLSSGQSFQDILDDFPYLKEIDLRAALAYAAWRTQEREFPLEAA